MISKKDILELETRKKIYIFIDKNPGLHLREISRKMNISLSVIRYHINFLKKQNLITTKNDHKYIRHYISQKISQEDKEVFNLLRQDIPRKLILLMLTMGPGDIYRNKKNLEKAKKNPTEPFKLYSKKELIELTKHWKGQQAKLFHLDKHPVTLDFHLKKLLAADLIEKVRVGKDMKYKLKDIDNIVTFFIVYNFELSDESINTWLNWTKPFLPKKIDKAINKIHEILPHPYRV